MRETKLIDNFWKKYKKNLPPEVKKYEEEYLRSHKERFLYTLRLLTKVIGGEEKLKEKKFLT